MLEIEQEIYKFKKFIILINKCILELLFRLINLS